MPETESQIEASSLRAARGLGPGPEAARLSGELAKKSAAEAFREARASRGDPAPGVRASVRGMVKGLLLAEADLPACSAAMLRETAAAAQEAGLDPMAAMTWAMEGIAGASSLLQPSALDAVREEIEARFMGAGAVFSELCSRAPNP
jgi:hypothetical protein